MGRRITWETLGPVIGLLKVYLIFGVKDQRDLMVSQSGDMSLRGSAWIILLFGFCS